MDNKTLVETLSKALVREYKDTKSLLEGFSVVIKERLCEMDSVAIPGFGEFAPEKHNEEIRTDLSSGKRILYPPAITVNFYPSALLKRKLSEQK